MLVWMGREPSPGQAGRVLSLRLDLCYQSHVVAATEDLANRRGYVTMVPHIVTSMRGRKLCCEATMRGMAVGVGRNGGGGDSAVGKW